MNVFKSIFSLMTTSDSGSSKNKKSTDLKTTNSFSPYGTSSFESKEIQKIGWRDIGRKIGEEQNASLIQLEHEKKLLKTKLTTIWKSQLDEINTTIDINTDEHLLYSKVTDSLLNEAKLIEISSILSRLSVYKTSITAYLDDTEADLIYKQCEMELIAGFEAGAAKFKGSEAYKQTIFARLTSN